MGSEKPKTLEDVVREAKRQYGALAYCSVDEDTYCAQEAAEWGREQATEQATTRQLDRAHNAGQLLAFVAVGERLRHTASCLWETEGWVCATRCLVPFVKARISELEKPDASS